MDHTTPLRRHARFPLENGYVFKPLLLAWAARQEPAAMLDNNNNPGALHSWECLVATGAADRLVCAPGSAFEALKHWYDTKHDWLFGLLCYDLKNEVERLSSQLPDGIQLPELAFFQPETVVGLRGNTLEIFSLHADPAVIFQEISSVSPAAPPVTPAAPLSLRARIPREAYFDKVEAVRRHIVEGDVYELNLCQEFYATEAVLDPVAVFTRLNSLARAPFSTFLHWDGRFLLSASPERFLRKNGDLLLSQPIKGTRRRGATPEADAALKADLIQSEKDRAENVMIVDLVRNDLARHCLPGSVQTPELFGIYSFPTVHQMISTVQGRLRPGAHPVDALRDAFPMGSMTGAPKVRAMQLIEQYEATRRGLYSGAVGYIDPAGNFDFNVVIRSILYNSHTRYCSLQVGGAIVYDSVPAQEYEECLVKAEALARALGTHL